MKTLDDFSKEDAQSAADASQQPRVDDADERENGENTTTVDWVDPTQQEKKKKRRTKKPKSKRGRVSLFTWTTLFDTGADGLEQTNWFRGILRRCTYHPRAVQL